MQTAIGLLCLCGALYTSLTRTALTALLFLFAGVAIPRVVLGVASSDFSAYTVTAMILESGSALLACWLLMRTGAEK